MREFKGFHRGIDLGGWLSQCGEGNYTEAHFQSFITEEDIRTIASWGLDHVRLPIDYNVLQNEDGSFKPEGFAHIERCMRWCKANGLRMVLDLHKAMGYVFDDKTYCQFFTEPVLQDHFVALWEELARRYAGEPDFVAFELLNEITARETAEIWNGIAKRTIAAIRKISKDVRIIIGGIFNSSIEGLTLLDAPADENIVFTFHCYSPLLFTHQSAPWVENMPLDFKLSYPGTVKDYRAKSYEFFKEDYDFEFQYEDEMLGERFFERLFQTALTIGQKYDVPLYCGEYGVIDQADPESTVRWYADMHAVLEKYGIPRAAWTYKEKDFGISDPHYAEVLPQLVQYL